MSKLRMAIAGVSVGIAIGAGLYMGWAILDFISNTTALNRFLIAGVGVSAPLAAAYVSIRDKLA